MQFKYIFILLVVCCLLFMVSLEFVYWQLRKTKSLLLLPFFLCFVERNTFGRLNYVFLNVGGAVLIVSYKLKYRRSWLYISCLNCWLFDTGGYEVRLSLPLSVHRWRHWCLPERRSGLHLAHRPDGVPFYEQRISAAWIVLPAGRASRKACQVLCQRLAIIRKM